MSNYINNLDQKKAECCIWYKGDIKVRECEALQAMAINKSGTLLIIANQKQRLTCIDLTNNHKDAFISLYSPNKQSRVVGIAFSPDGESAIVARDNNITLMHCNNSKVIILGKSVDVFGTIKNVFFPKLEQIICVMEDNSIKTFNVYHILNEQSVISENVFKASSNCQIITNDNSYPMIALWKKNKNNIQNQIIIKNVENSNQEEMVFNVQMLQDKYEYISKQGRSEYKKTHLSHVDVCSNIMAAIATDGKLHWWKIIDKIPEIIQNVDSEKKEEAICEIPKKRSPRFMHLTLSGSKEAGSRSSDSNSESSSSRKKRDRGNSINRLFLTAGSDHESTSPQSSPITSPKDSPDDSPKGLFKKSNKNISESLEIKEQKPSVSDSTYNVAINKL